MCLCQCLDVYFFVFPLPNSVCVFVPCVQVCTTWICEMCFNLRPFCLVGQGVRWVECWSRSRGAVKDLSVYCSWHRVDVIFSWLQSWNYNCLLFFWPHPSYHLVFRHQFAIPTERRNILRIMVPSVLSEYEFVSKKPLDCWRLKKTI